MTTESIERRVRREFKSIELGPRPDFTLTSLEVGLSSNCNFRCKYCCAYHPNDKKVMPAERVIEILKGGPNLRRVKLSGGEVLIYLNECVKVVEYCTSRGIQTQINTNGSLLDANAIKLLEGAGLGCLHFSFNYTDAREFSDYYGQTPRVFERVQSNIRLAARSAIDTVAETIIFKRTEHTLPDVHRHLYGLGVRKHEIQNAVPIAQTGWEDILPRSQVEAVIENLLENRQPEMKLYFSCVDIGPTGPFRQKVMQYVAQGNVYFPACIEGRNQLHLHSNGDVLICELGYPTVIGNVNDGTRLDDLLRNKPPALVEFLARSGNGKCVCSWRAAGPAAFAPGKQGDAAHV